MPDTEAPADQLQSPRAAAVFKAIQAINSSPESYESFEEDTHLSTPSRVVEWLEEHKPHLEIHTDTVRYFREKWRGEAIAVATSEEASPSPAPAYTLALTQRGEELLRDWEELRDSVAEGEGADISQVRQELKDLRRRVNELEEVKKSVGETQGAVTDLENRLERFEELDAETGVTQGDKPEILSLLLKEGPIALMVVSEVLGMDPERFINAETPEEKEAILQEWRESVGTVQPE